MSKILIGYEVKEEEGYFILESTWKRSFLGLTEMRVAGGHPMVGKTIALPTTENEIETIRFEADEYDELKAKIRLYEILLGRENAEF